MADMLSRAVDALVVAAIFVGKGAIALGALRPLFP
jgi:hypothetical protein